MANIGNDGLSEEKGFFSVGISGFIDSTKAPEIQELVGRLGDLGLKGQIIEAPYRTHDEGGELLMLAPEVGWVITERLMGAYGRRRAGTLNHGTSVFGRLSRHLLDRHEGAEGGCVCGLCGGDLRDGMQRLRYVDPGSLIRAYDSGALEMLPSREANIASRNQMKPFSESVTYDFLGNYLQALRS